MYIKQITPQICKEFEQKVAKIFGENLIFGFIFGGIAKGYATHLEHDIDMFVCMKSRNAQQEEMFKSFYFDIHRRYRFAADHKDPVEFATYSECMAAASHLENLKICKTMPTYKDYESVVWCDIFAGNVVAKVGNMEPLQGMHDKCKDYPEKWRSDILEFLSDKEKEQEGREAIQKDHIIGLLCKNLSPEVIEDDGGVENLKNNSLAALQKKLADLGIKYEVNVGSHDAALQAGLEALRTKPVTLLFEKYVKYLEKSRPACLLQDASCSSNALGSVH